MIHAVEEHKAWKGDGEVAGARSNFKSGCQEVFFEKSNI